MARIQLLIISLGFVVLAAHAQDNRKEERAEKVQAAKVAYITTKINLTTQQSQQFWPVYNELENSRKKIRKSIRALRVDNAAGGSEVEIAADIKKMFALRQEELDLEKLYSDKFLKVISASQLAEFYRSEKEFTKLLLRRLGEGMGKRRRGGPGGPGGSPPPDMDPLDGQ